jgi:hypothetical protein
MQDLVAILIVAVSAAFLVRRTWQRVARRTGSACGSCPSCNSNRTLTLQSLVTISPEMSHAKAQRREEILT